MVSYCIFRNINPVCTDNSSTSHGGWTQLSRQLEPLFTEVDPLSGLIRL